MKNTCTNCQAENDSNSKYCSVCGYQLPILENQNSTIENEKSKVVKPKKQVNWKGLVGFAVAFTVMFFVSQSLFKPSVDSQLTEIASEMNKSCPMRVDEFTTLKNVAALPNKTLQYNYVLVGSTKAEVQLDSVKKYFFPQLLQNVKTDPTMQLFRDNEVTLSYTYYDTTGEYVTEYVIKPEMYQ